MGVPGQDPAHVLEAHRNHPHCRPLSCQVVESAAKFADSGIGGPRAFGKEDERVSSSHGGGHLFDGIVRARDGFARDEQGIEKTHRNGAGEPGAVPVIARRHGSGAVARFRGQRGPERGKVQMAAVIGHEVSLPLLQAIADMLEEVLHRSLAHAFNGVHPKADNAFLVHGETFQALVHIRTEYSTFRWLLEPMLAATGFTVYSTDGTAKNMCSKLLQ